MTSLGAQRTPSGLFHAERPVAPVQWAAIAGSIAILVWSVPGLFINPDFAIGDDATSELVLGVDMNGWHAVSGFLVALPGFVAALRAQWSAIFNLAAAGSLIATGIWALASTEVAVGLFYFPNQTGDALLHFGTSAIFLAGAAHYFSRGESPRQTGSPTSA